MKSIWVFIYGTLLPGECNHHVVSGRMEAGPPGQIAGRLVDCGDYPAAVRDSVSRERNSIIRGRWIAVDREALAAMDELEEFMGIEESNDYERVWVRDAAAANRAGWAYVWAGDRGCPAIPGGYWPDYGKGKGKDV